MRHLPPALLLACALLGACGPSGVGAGGHDSRMEALYDSVDAEMAHSEDYRAHKEQRIALLRDELETESDPERRVRITDRLIGEFESYNSDSALHYVNANLASPIVNRDARARSALLIRKADITSRAGLFADALAIMAGVRPDRSDTAMMENYYSTYCGIYQYQAEYTQDS